MEKINSIKDLKDQLVKAQEKDLSFKSACDGMQLKEDSNAMEHVLRDRNRDIASLNKIIRENERQEMKKLTTPPRSVYYTDEHGQTFVDIRQGRKRPFGAV